MRKAGDGEVDLASARGAPIPFSGTGTASLAVGDFNGDGRQDLAVVNSNLNVLLPGLPAANPSTRSRGCNYRGSRGPCGTFRRCMGSDIELHRTRHPLLQDRQGQSPPALGKQ